MGHFLNRLLSTERIAIDLIFPVHPAQLSPAQQPFLTSTQTQPRQSTIYACKLTIADTPEKYGNVSVDLDQTTASGPAATMLMPMMAPTTLWVVDTGSCNGRQTSALKQCRVIEVEPASRRPHSMDLLIIMLVYARVLQSLVIAAEQQAVIFSMLIPCTFVPALEAVSPQNRWR